MREKVSAVFEDVMFWVVGDLAYRGRQTDRDKSCLLVGFRHCRLLSHFDIAQILYLVKLSV